MTTAISHSVLSGFVQIYEEPALLVQKFSTASPSTSTSSLMPLSFAVVSALIFMD